MAHVNAAQCAANAAQCAANPAGNRIAISLSLQFVVSVCCADWAILTNLTATEEVKYK
jgi:hypothetical protein